MAAGDPRLRQLPAVDRLLQHEAARALVAEYGHDLTVTALRQALDAVRQSLRGGQPIVAGDAAAGDDAALQQQTVARAAAWLEDLVAPSLAPLINATGVIVHTNLGRAPLSAPARAAVAAVAAGYSALEYDLPAGERGSRSVHAASLLARLTGAEAAFVVNNNAAAVLLMLTALASGREVIISRGQLVEIGGGFRVPDVMAQSGARLVEVGTTNRTHLDDYARAMTAETAAILVAHHSNFKIVGFTSEPSLAELASLAADHGLPLLYDQGSGALLDTAAYGLDPEPLVQDALAAGAGLVTFSGDKLLGGPQAGILAGRRDLVGAVARHPLARAVRPDKLCLAALAATLVPYLTGRAPEQIPVWQMIARPAAELAATAASWAAALRDAGLAASTQPGESTVGGGSLPGATLPTTLVAVDHPAPHQLAAALRTRAQPPVIARIAGDLLLLDPRTVLPGEDELLLAALRQLADTLYP
jgi:L-seryl-tRNA(Ser) seleniumtransferase